MRTRFLCLGLALVGLLWTVWSFYDRLQRRAIHLRAQPLVSLIVGTRTPGLDTVQSVRARDAALVPQVREAIRRGSDVNGFGETAFTYNDQREFTPLILAAMHRLPACTRVLIEHGADVNATDERGKTPLMWAVKSGNTEVVRELLAAGANTHIVDLHGCTARDYAENYGFGWDRREAVLIPLKRAHAPPGPHALQKIDPNLRFRLVGYARFGSLSGGSNAGKVPFSAHVELELTADGPAILTRARYNRIQSGMSYSDVAKILGQAETGGVMGDTFSGSFTFKEAGRSITLQFKNAEVTGKSCWGLGWW